jgi:hypothetical protein
MNIELGGGRRKPVNEEGGKRSCIDVFWCTIEEHGKGMYPPCHINHE